MWGRLPCEADPAVLEIAPGETVTIDTVSHEGILEDQGKDPAAYFGGHGVAASDVLTDAPMNDIIDEVRESGAAASMLIVPPQSSFHCVNIGDSGSVTGITPVSHLPIWENGGYFVLSGEVLDMLTEDCDLVEDVCGRLATQGRLHGYKHLGFWKPADTFKERAELEAAYKRGERPWMLWEHAKEPVELDRAPVTSLARS